MTRRSHDARRAALAAEIAARLAAVEAQAAELRPLVAELAGLAARDAASVAPGRMLPLAQAARVAGVSLDTARRRAREHGRKGDDQCWRVDPADLAPRGYRRPASG